MSELIRRASTPPMGLVKKGRVWVWLRVCDLPPDTPKLSSAQVKQALEDFP